MGNLVVAGVSGLLFGIGLAISGMYDPAVVLGFLDVAGLGEGNWDPSLALVMIGALAIAAPGFGWAKRRSTPIAGLSFQQPAGAKIDRDLVAGSALFGIGWGLVGYCPGPALAALGFGQGANLAFVAAMIGGMTLHRLTLGKR